jgi:TonB family protein
MSAVIAHLVSFWIAVAVHLWQTTLVLIPILCLAGWLRSAPARFLYGVWAIAFLKIAVPVALLGTLVHPLLRAVLPPGPPAANATLAAVSALLNPDRSFDLQGAAGDARVWILVLVLTGAWVAGIFGACRDLRRAHRASRSERGRSLAECPPELAARIGAALAGTGIHPHHVLVIARPSPPQVTGLVAPRILLPTHLITTLTAAELRGILLHEEMHRRRRDPLRIAVFRLVTALLFFYPLGHAVLRRLAAATEILCDETAVRAGARQEALARAIAETVRLRLSPGPEPLAATLGGVPPLRTRFDRLVHPERYSPMKKHWFVIAASLALAAAGTFGPGWLAAGENGENGDAPPAPPAEAESLPLDKTPAPISSTIVQPTYPEAEKRAGIEGMVILRVTITAKGAVSAMEATTEVRGHPAFTQSATAAIGRWRFEPGEIQGKPVECKVMIPVKFKLD